MRHRGKSPGRLRIASSERLYWVSRGGLEHAGVNAAAHVFAGPLLPRATVYGAGAGSEASFPVRKLPVTK
jgi:hypothetical protein